MSLIISFEGIDGTGKGTQLELCEKWLRESGKNIYTFSFPMYETYFGGQVGRYLTAKDGVRADSVDGKSMALWFALDRFDALRGFDVSPYDVIFINRYVLSNAVYQSIRERDGDHADLLDFVYDLEFNRLGIPKPDRILLFDMDLQSASENVSRKGFRDYVGSSGKDIYESVPDIQLRARKKYLDYASRLDNVSVIPCMGPNGLKSIGEIAVLVRDALSDLF